MKTNGKKKKITEEMGKDWSTRQHQTKALDETHPEEEVMAHGDNDNGNPNIRPRGTNV